MANEYFVVIAGAGASRDLGHQPLPLMGDWAASIVEDLGKGPTSPDSIGLRDEMDGFEFEKALGRFLEAQQHSPQKSGFTEEPDKQAFESEPNSPSTP